MIEKHAPDVYGAGKVENMEDNMTLQNMQTAENWDFDALLKEKEFQSEFDRRVSRALETARGKWAKETEERIQRECAAAEKRARMTGEERMAHDFAEREAQLKAREQEIMRRELRAEAMRLLQERELPHELADAMNYASAEALQESVDAAECAFRAAVQQGIEQRLRGSAPTGNHRKTEGEQSDADYYRANYARKK